MILAGQLLLDDGAGRCRVSSGLVRTQGEVIVEVAEGDLPAHFDHGGPHALITPGFIDTHLHLPQFDMIGAHGLPLLSWLSNVTFPAEGKWSEPDYARGMTDRAIDQLLAVGTTGICAYATVHHKAAIAALEVAAQRGMRGVIGQVLMDRNAPDDLCRPAAQLLDEAAELGHRFPANGRIAAAVTPRFAVACSPELLAGAAQLAKDQQSLIQSHLAETLDECEWVRQLFGGQTYVEVYRETDLLTPRSIFGHGVHLDDDDRKLLSASSALIAHCPTANSFLRSGTMNHEFLRSGGVPLTLGSDVGAGYERSMVRVARAMIEAASTLGNHNLAAATAWHAITAGNADALGWSDAGRLRAGGAADLLVIEPTIAWQEGTVDPLAMLMFAWDDRWLKTTVLRGECFPQR